MSDFVPRPFWVESLNVPRLPTSVESLNVPRPFWVRARPKERGYEPLLRPPGGGGFVNAVPMQYLGPAGILYFKIPYRVFPISK